MLAEPRLERVSRCLLGLVLLGGSVGVGTLVFAVGVGPNVAWWLPRLDLRERVRPTAPARCG